MTSLDLRWADLLETTVLNKVGVIPDAEIFEFELTTKDIFILIASDGVFEFMSNELVAKIVTPHYSKLTPEAAANEIGNLIQFNKYSQRSS